MPAFRPSLRPLTARELPGVVEARGCSESVKAVALPRDVERGPMIDRGADDRQPERDVDRRARTPAASSARAPGRGTCTRWRRRPGGARPGRRRCRRDAVPIASMPLRVAASIAGAMWSMSSVPNSPCSPACGFRPHTAIRGFGEEPARVASLSARSRRARARRRTRSIASRNEQWVLTWVTASGPWREHHRHPLPPAQRRRSTRCGRRSAGSDSCVASLFIGIVTTPATVPARASVVARST